MALGMILCWYKDKGSKEPLRFYRRIEMRGVVKFFDSKKGWGFIAPTGDASSQDVFVHFTAISQDGYKTLNEGDSVTFELGVDDRGRRSATNVRIETNGKVERLCCQCESDASSSRSLKVRGENVILCPKCKFELLEHLLSAPHMTVEEAFDGWIE